MHMAERARKVYMKKFIIIILISIVTLLVIILGIKIYINNRNHILVYSDVSDYEKYRSGENADKNFKSKFAMDESIWPEKITESMEVKDYKMVYYNPWDAQYLGYLIVKYDNDEYLKEISRLNDYKSTEYKGYYGAEGFSKYNLVAMYADSYNGFVYALTDNQNTVIYVELIFCNYFMDIDYTEYIDGDYLPVGFDATVNNPTRKKWRLIDDET